MAAADPPHPQGHGPGEGGGAEERLSAVERNRLRWRCRRGMLENDLILTRFLDQRGSELTRGEVAALDRLLDLPDDALWDLLSGRREASDPATAPILRVLQSV